MRRHRHPSVLVAMLAAALTLSACDGDDGGGADPVDLEATGDDTTDDVPADDAPDADDGAEGDDGTTGDAAGGEVDTAVARPGTWPVGDAGTVTFDVDGGALVLGDVVADDGWEVTEEEVDGDDIDVEFRRGDERWEFEVDLEDGGSRLEIHIDHTIDPAEPGTYEFGDAGSVTFSSDGSTLTLDDLTVADGWEITQEQVDGDDIDIDVQRDDQRWEIRIELDDGVIDVELDYEVRGTL